MKCETCDYCDLLPTGDGVCMELDIPVEGKDEACSFFEKRTDSLEDEWPWD